MKILLIEDDFSTSEAIRLSLQVNNTGNMVEIVETGKLGLALARIGTFDIVILDLGLPDIDGITVLEELRTFSQVPVLVISARHDPQIINDALTMGAQDFLLKPFDLQVFLASLHDVLQSQAETAATRLSYKITPDLTVRFSEHVVILKDRTVELNAAEWTVLEELLTHYGRIVTVKALKDKLSPDGSQGDIFVHQTVNQLRKKIGDDQYTPGIILSDYSCGFRLKKAR